MGVVRLITGRGLHNRTGRSRLGPVIAGLLDRRGVAYSLQDAGVVTLLLNNNHSSHSKKKAAEGGGGRRR